MSRAHPLRRRFDHRSRCEKEHQNRSIHLWTKYALAYILVMAIPFIVFSVMANRHLTEEMNTSIKSEISSTLKDVQDNIDQRVKQMATISLQVGLNRDFKSIHQANYSYDNRMGVQQMLHAFWATGQCYQGISYYQRDLPAVVFTVNGNCDMKDYRTFYDGQTGTWLTLSQITDAQLCQVWYTPTQNTVVEHEATTSKINEDQLFYCNQRGIGPEDAVGLIVNGYAREVLSKLPMEFAVEAQKLLQVSLEGSVG